MTARLIALAVLVAATTACSIQPESGPKDLPDEVQGAFGGAATGDVAAGTNRIYLLAPGDPEEPQRLRSVLRDVPTEPFSVLESLFAGPNSDERAEQIDTAIPSDVALIDTRVLGPVLTVDVSDAFGELTPEGLRLAVGQIVATSTGIDGVAAVQLRIEGEPTVWPLGNGELADRPLTAFDYPGLVESTQPDYPGIPSGSQ